MNVCPKDVVTCCNHKGAHIHCILPLFATSDEHLPETSFITTSLLGFGSQGGTRSKEMPGTLNGQVQWMTLQLGQSAMIHLGMGWDGSSGQAVPSGQSIGKKSHAKSCIIGMWFAYMPILNMSITYLFCSCRLLVKWHVVFPIWCCGFEAPTSKKLHRVPENPQVFNAITAVWCWESSILRPPWWQPWLAQGPWTASTIQGQFREMRSYNAMGRCSIYELNWHIY